MTMKQAENVLKTLTAAKKSTAWLEKKMDKARTTPTVATKKATAKKGRK